MTDICSRTRRGPPQVPSERSRSALTSGRRSRGYRTWAEAVAAHGPRWAPRAAGVELFAFFLREGRLRSWGHLVLLLRQMGPKNQAGNPAAGNLLLTMLCSQLLLQMGHQREDKRTLVAPSELQSAPSGLSVCGAAFLNIKPSQSSPCSVAQMSSKTLLPS